MVKTTVGASLFSSNWSQNGAHKKKNKTKKTQRSTDAKVAEKKEKRLPLKIWSEQQQTQRKRLKS